MRLVGLAAMMATIALVATAIPALAQGTRAAKRTAEQAQYAVQNTAQDVDQALYQAQNAGQDADRTAAQTEEMTDAVTQETTAVTIPESSGISTDNVVLLAVGGSVLLIGAWLIASEATR